MTPPAWIAALSAAPYNEAGWVDLTIRNSNGEYQEERAFLYLSSEIGPLKSMVRSLKNSLVTAEESL